MHYILLILSMESNLFIRKIILINKVKDSMAQVLRPW